MTYTMDFNPHQIKVKKIGKSIDLGYYTTRYVVENRSSLEIQKVVVTLVSLGNCGTDINSLGTIKAGAKIDFTIKSSTNVDYGVQSVKGVLPDGRPFIHNFNMAAGGILAFFGMMIIICAIIGIVLVGWMDVSENFKGSDYSLTSFVTWLEFCLVVLVAGVAMVLYDYKNSL